MLLHVDVATATSDVSQVFFDFCLAVDPSSAGALYVRAQVSS